MAAAWSKTSPAAIVGRGEENPEPAEREQQDEGSFAVAHTALPEDSPEGEYGEYSERDQRQFFVRLHQLVDCFPVLDVPLGLESGDDRSGSGPGRRPSGSRSSPAEIPVSW